MEKVRALIAVLTVLGDAIEAVEALFPNSGAGKWKLAAVLEICREAVADIVPDFETIRPTVERIVDKLVAAKNALGAWFDREAA